MWSVVHGDLDRNCVIDEVKGPSVAMDEARRITQTGLAGEVPARQLPLHLWALSHTNHE